MLHLRYFVAVAEELNFSQAARKLHMAASPLSQRIKDLERELGQPLFERSTHHVALTPAGAALLPMARDVLERVNSIPWRLREAVRPQRATLLIGMPSGVHPALRARVRDLEAACRESYELKRWPGRSTGLAEAVRDGRLALALARLPASDPALGVIEVMRERLGAAVPADRFAGRESVTLDELRDLPYVATASEAMPAAFDEIDTRLHAAGVKKRLRINSSDYSGASELVSGGMAFSVTMLSAESPMQLYRLDNVVVLPVVDFPAELATGLLYRTDRAEPGGDLEELVAAAYRIFADELRA
ncbi:MULTISPECIES: LysR family transcriptional regulator [Streptomyces]|uniref:LysR family transcriptional regulator n=1 Tax=Streptomyces TaxID=1883 RepID=UPI001F3F0B7C|nr:MULTISPECIES: LysR family transcriptional regulator [Streptomyces]